MARFLRNYDQKAGLPPGSLIFTGRLKDFNPQFQVTTYDSESLQDDSFSEYEGVEIFEGERPVLWFNIDGVHDSELIKKVGDDFALTTMELEDIQDTGRRADVQEYPEHLFTSLKVLKIDGDDSRVTAEQVSLILGDNFLLTLQEYPGLIFEPVRRRLARGKGKIRQKGPDYLFYTLLDCILENYLSVVEKIGERIEELEEEVVDDPARGHLEEIVFYRREVAYIRKAIRPVREIISKINRLDSEFISEDIAPYLRDLAGIIEQTLDSLEVYKEILGDLFTTYNMVIGTRLNETMKFLTIFATIFIPLTFIAGIYGMNFEFMPELKFKYAYFVLLAVMGVVALGMLMYFKRKKWI